MFVSKKEKEMKRDKKEKKRKRNQEEKKEEKKIGQNDNVLVFSASHATQELKG